MTTILSSLSSFKAFLGFFATPAVSHGWLLVTVAILLVFLYWHYRSLPSKAEKDSFRLDSFLLEPHQKKIEDLADGFTEARYIREIQGCMIASRALAKRKTWEKEAKREPDTPVFLDTEDDPESEVSQPPETESVTGVDRDSEDSGTVLQNEEDLDTEEEDEDENDLGRMIAFIDQHENGKKILEIFEIYEESLEAPELYVLISGVFDYVCCADESSIAERSNTTDEEVNEYRNQFDILRNISILEHVKNVVEEITKEMRSMPGFEDSIAADYLLMAVYHDIGKLSLHRKIDGKYESYRMLNHPVLSTTILQDRLPDVNDLVIAAIQQHHKPQVFSDAEAYHRALRAADQRARQRETQSQVGAVPALRDRVTKENLIAIAIEILQAEIGKSGGAIPNATIVKGYLLIKKDLYLDLLTKKLEQVYGLCREQLEGGAIVFNSAALSVLSEKRLVPEAILDKKINLVINQFGKQRSQTLDRHLAIPVESLGVKESELPHDNYDKNISRLEFR